MTDTTITFDVTGNDHREIMLAAKHQAQDFFGDTPYRITHVEVRPQLEQIGIGTVTWIADVEAKTQTSW